MFCEQIFVILISKSDGRPNFDSELADVLDEKVSLLLNFLSVLTFKFTKTLLINNNV